MSRTARSFRLLLMALVSAAGLGLALQACTAELPDYEPGPGGGPIFTNPGSDGGKDGGVGDGGADAGTGNACAALCARAEDSAGCSAGAATPDCRASCLKSLLGEGSNGSYAVDARGVVSPVCSGERPAARCTGLAGDELTHCLAPLVEHCTGICGCQASCSGLFALEYRCNQMATDCGSFGTCLNKDCGGEGESRDAGSGDGSCPWGTVTFQLEGAVRSACAQTTFNVAYLVIDASGTDPGGTSAFDLLLSIENQSGVHPVPALDPVHHAWLGIGAEGRSYSSEAGAGVVVVNGIADRTMTGAFSVDVVDREDGARVRAVSGSFDVRY